MIKIIGYRGVQGLATENTLVSILKALECDADEIKIDVRVTLDGVPVLNNSAYLACKDKTRLAIADHTAKELRSAWPDFATLEEAIRTIDRHVPLIIEIKSGVAVEPIVAVLQNFFKEGWKAHDFLLGSKSQKILRTLRASLPTIELVVIESWSGVRAGMRARQLKTKRICMNQHFMWFGFIKAMSGRGYHLTAYTLNNPRKAIRWARYGLYGIVTDYPERFTHRTVQR